MRTALLAAALLVCTAAPAHAGTPTTSTHTRGHATTRPHLATPVSTWTWTRGH